MNYMLIQKDGTKIPITAQTYRRVIPRIEFYNTIVKGGRKVDEVVHSVAIDDVTTVLLVDEEIDDSASKKEESPST